MKKIRCKNGCSGKKGFTFEGKVPCSGLIDGDGLVCDGDQAPFIEVIYYECIECGNGWEIPKGERLYL